jgi:ABC-type Fe3+ transport system permease subunit
MYPKRNSKVCTTIGPRMRLKHFYPLLGFLIPNLVIGYGVVIPRSPIAGVNEQTIGFGMALLGACIAYWQGIRSALRGHTPSEEEKK